MLRNPAGSEAFMTIDGHEVPICGNEGFDQEPCDDRSWFMSLYDAPEPEPYWPYWPPPPPPPPKPPKPPAPPPEPPYAREIRKALEALRKDVGARLDEQARKADRLA